MSRPLDEPAGRRQERDWGPDGIPCRPRRDVGPDGVVCRPRPDVGGVSRTSWGLRRADDAGGTPCRPRPDVGPDGVVCRERPDVGGGAGGRVIELRCGSELPCGVTPRRRVYAGEGATDKDRVFEKVPPEVLLDELVRGRRRRSDCAARDRLRTLARQAIPELARSVDTLDTEIHPHLTRAVALAEALRVLLDSGMPLEAIVDRLFPGCGETGGGGGRPRPLGQDPRRYG